MSIKIDLAILLFMILFCMTAQIEIYLVLLLFAVIHELGHLCVGVVAGFKPQEIQISPMGVRLEFKPKLEEYNSKKNTLQIKRAIISAAGPLTNFIIIIITMALMYANNNLQTSNICTIIIYSNLIIGFFNLIPIYPLDGGRIIKEIFCITKGIRKSYKYTYLVSKTTIIIITAISSIAILYIHNIAIIIVLIYLWGIVLIERKKYKQKQSLYNKLFIEETNNSL